MIYQVSIPISDYTQTGVFQLSVYIESEKCPTKIQVLDLLNTLNNEEVELSESHPEYGPFIFEYKQAIDSILSIEDFPFVGSRMNHHGFPMETPFGCGHLSITKLLIHHI